MRVSYRKGLSSFIRTGKRKFQYLERWRDPRVSDVHTISSCHGLLKRLVVDFGPDGNGIRYRLEFHLSQEHPLFFWRLSLENHGNQPIEVERIEMLRAGFFPKRRLLPSPGPLSSLYHSKPVGYGAVRPSPHPGELGFFSNGWQSWSHTGAYSADDCYRSTQLGIFAAPVWYAPGKAPPKKPGVFTSDFFGVIGDRTHRTGILVGYLSQKNHFGSLDTFIGDPFYPALRLWADGDRARLDPGASITTDWAAIQFVDLDNPDPLEPYLTAVARQNRLSTTTVSRPSFTGWCSWYQFYNDIDSEKLQTNLDFAAQIRETIPLELFQVDDGFESRVGDWYDFSPGFPNGVSPLAKQIQAVQFEPGLWLAPFILHSRSKTARKHRQWLLRNRFGFAVNAGFLWNNLTKALDLSRPEVLDYITELIHTAVHDWGFSYLKLDFLYAAALKGLHHDRTKTRAQVLRQGLEAIREAAGSATTLLGCGVPLGPSIGIFDVIRIGPDVAPYWEPELIPPKAFFRQEPNLPSIRNALQNMFSRTAFHHRWWVNDPDCLILRPDSDLTLGEVQTLATAIAMSGGSLLLSDHLPELPKDRLRIAKQMIPLIDQRPRVMDWFDSSTPKQVRLDLMNQTGKWYLLAVFNYSSRPYDFNLSLEELDLPLADYFAREFWSGDLSWVVNGNIELLGISPHGVKLVALTPVHSNPHHQDSKLPCYLGGDLHISQGLEVTEWTVSTPGELRLQLERPGNTSGTFDLFLPIIPEKVEIQGGEIQWQPKGQNFYRFQVSFNQVATIIISGSTS